MRDVGSRENIEFMARAPDPESCIPLDKWLKPSRNGRIWAVAVL